MTSDWFDMGWRWPSLLQGVAVRSKRDQTNQTCPACGRDTFNVLVSPSGLMHLSCASCQADAGAVIPSTTYPESAHDAENEG